MACRVLSPKKRTSCSLRLPRLFSGVPNLAAASNFVRIFVLLMAPSPLPNVVPHVAHSARRNASPARSPSGASQRSTCGPPRAPLAPRLNTAVSACLPPRCFKPKRFLAVQDAVPYSLPPPPPPPLWRLPDAGACVKLGANVAAGPFCLLLQWMHGCARCLPSPLHSTCLPVRLVCATTCAAASLPSRVRTAPCLHGSGYLRLSGEFAVEVRLSPRDRQQPARAARVALPCPSPHTSEGEGAVAAASR